MYWSNVIYSVVEFFRPKLVFLSGAKNGSFGFSALAHLLAKTRVPQKVSGLRLACLFTTRHTTQIQIYFAKLLLRPR